MFLAKAVYDNIAESPDELAFRRGDVLTVTELDTGGLDGWWLCSLRGKQGIAPGNRLKILSGMSDYSFDESASASIENFGLRLSKSFDKPVDERGSSVQDIYDEPSRNQQDYDVPPSRYHPKDMKKSPEDGNKENLKHLLEDKNSEKTVHDSPQYSDMPNCDSQTYDVPQQPLKTLSQGVLGSNRSSVLSNTSNESPLASLDNTSTASSQRSSSVVSVCDSARSSLDVSSQELYETPPKVLHNSKQLSADSGLDIYDTPPKAKLAQTAFLTEDYDFPKMEKVDLAVLQVPSHSLEPTAKPKMLEHSVDEVYDVPKNNAPRDQMKGLTEKVSILSPESQNTTGNDSVCVYDIPPQVTRDSVISSRSDSSEEGHRLSTCSTDSRGSLTDIPTYDELPIEMDAALDLLTKLQQDVQITVNKFCGFVSSTWRKKESLQTKLYDIKLASTGVKTSLNDFIQFSQGTVANSAKLADKKLVNKLYKQLSPLQNSLQLISSALKNLEDLKWQIDFLVEPLDSSKSDDLGQIANLCKDLTGHVRKLASLIQGNATLLFSKIHEIESTSITRERKGVSECLNAAKPPIGPKPEIGPKKGKFVQQRPLPPPPTTSRPLPPTPEEDRMNSLRLGYEDKSHVSEPSEQDSIYANDTSEWITEYDYVHLESRDSVAQLRGKEHIPGFEKEDSPSESECDHREDNDKVEDPYEVKLEADLENLDKSSKQDESENASFDIDNITDEKNPMNTNADLNTLFLTGKDELISFDSDHLDPNDKQVLVFYSGQMETHSTLLANALDAFFSCVESNEPPNVFISHSKFVIVSAHKLVYIGDTLHRNIMHSRVKNKIMLCANQLCDSLKLSVNATKLAALQYPSVPAVQEMVDRVVAVSKAANNLKVVIAHASSM